MNVKEGLNVLDFLATGINKEDPAIKAVLSDDEGKGALANELEAVASFINYYSRTNDVRDHKGKSLELITRLFANLWRRVNESDDILLRRFLALTWRKGDTIWGDSLDLIHVLETYFNGIKCYVAENTNVENLLPDGDFDTDNTWALVGASFNYESRFTGSRGLSFRGLGVSTGESLHLGISGNEPIAELDYKNESYFNHAFITGNKESCEQEVKKLFNAGIYTFHFMLCGKCGVVIQREDGKYWNSNDQEYLGEVLKWVENEVINIFDTDGWDNASCFLVLPNETHSLTIKFVGIENETALIDHARLFIKPLNPSYTIIIQYSGLAVTDITLHLGISGNEPITELDYKNESYFNHAFITGTGAVTQNQSFITALEKVRPKGIQTFIEIVEKEEREDL
jgi:hypothetical protein